MKCKHCNLDYDEAKMIKNDFGSFCCKGCEAVYKLLHSKGWQDFYKLRSNTELEPVSTEEYNKNYDNFVRKNEDGFCEIYLYISNIHCSACIWLNEKILNEEDGVLEATVNLATHKAKVVYDDSLISLDKILQLISCIGYKASAYDPLKQEIKSTELKREFYAKLIVAIACVMNIMWIAIAKYAGLFSGMQSDIKDILNFAEFILCTPVLFYTGSSFYKSAYTALKFKQINMDFLVISGASLAYAYSLWAMFARLPNVYFDSVAMIICFVFVGKYLEVLSKKYASDTMDGLNEFLLSKIFVYDGKDFVPKDVYAVNVGELVRLRAGDKILIDGLCVEGEASVDTSSLNGENEALLLKKDSIVNSACTVIDGHVVYKTTSLYKDSKLSQIVSLLEEAQNNKPKIQALVEKINTKFSRTVLFLAFLCFCFWFFYKEAGFELSLINAISVLIISCPCALALATPISTLSALFSALKMKILFKNPNSIEELSKCTVGVFDKTGVLTDSNLKISKSKLNDKLNLNELLSFISLSKHPLSNSLRQFLLEKDAKFIDMKFEDVKELRAKGIKARLGKDSFLGGNLYFIKENNITCSYEIKDTHFIFAKNGEILAIFEFQSSIKEGAKRLLSYLKSLNIKILMLTGDNEKAAAKIAKELDIKEFKANCLPQDKMNAIKELNQKEKVFFVGDGINDALALKVATVSFSLKNGSDIAMENSDVLLLKSDLKSVENSLKLAKKTYKIIKQNLAFSLCYNALSITLAFLGLINPLIAAASMSFSSLVVILNSLRIKNK